MATTTHKRSMHIDAPVETVFDYVKDPHRFFEAMPEKDRSHMALAEVTLTPDGVGSTYRLMGRMFLLFHMEWVLTREEYIPNERIVDHAFLGRMISTFEPADPTGTTLSLAFEWSMNLPLVGEVVDQVIDRVSWDGDRDLDQMLANLKKAIEA